MIDEKTRRGQQAYQSGKAAEDAVCRFYECLGARELSRRWRSKAGEIDLIFRLGGQVIFVEVKHSKSHDTALAALSDRQVGRIFAAAEEFAGQDAQGSLTEMRFDVALVDRRGAVRILEGVWGS